MGAKRGSNETSLADSSVVQKRVAIQESETEVLAQFRNLSDGELANEISRYRDELAEKGLTTLSKSEVEEAVALVPDDDLVEEDDDDEEEQNDAAPEEAAPSNQRPSEGGAEDDMEEGDISDVDPREWMVPPFCIPVHANVTSYNWKPLIESTKFDAIMMDPPWQLATANPTRGVSLGYSQLTDHDITNLPIPKLQTNGLLFVWVINAKYKFTLDLFKKWGYTYVDEIVWVKMTVNRRLAKSHGFYLQHAKEVCLVAKKGDHPPGFVGNGGSDIILSERRGQSQKPTEIYELIEKLIPNGKYLEIFARKNNLRNFWVSMGNEVTGTGAPEEDLQAVKNNQAPQGAVYGAGNK